LLLQLPLLLLVLQILGQCRSHLSCVLALAPQTALQLGEPTWQTTAAAAAAGGFAAAADCCGWSLPAAVAVGGLQAQPSLCVLVQALQGHLHWGVLRLLLLPMLLLWMSGCCAVCVWCP
jgi:hypothetical protein